MKTDQPAEPMTLQETAPTEALNQDVIQSVESLFATEYSNAKGGNTALDPAMWGIIIDAVSTMVKKCIESRGTGGGLIPGGVVSTGNERNDATMYMQAAKRGGPIARFHIRRHVRPALTEAYGPHAWRIHDGPAIVDAVITGSAKADQATVQRFLIEVQRS